VHGHALGSPASASEGAESWRFNTATSAARSSSSMPRNDWSRIAFAAAISEAGTPHVRLRLSASTASLEAADGLLDHLAPSIAISLLEVILGKPSAERGRRDAGLLGSRVERLAGEQRRDGGLGLAAPLLAVAAHLRSPAIICSPCTSERSAASASSSWRSRFAAGPPWRPSRVTDSPR
jgi:hypothetical protein